MNSTGSFKQDFQKGVSELIYKSHNLPESEEKDEVRLSLTTSMQMQSLAKCL
jgi:hypothetical protein